MNTTSPESLRQELQMLQQEKGKTCISIIIPFDNLPDQTTATKHIEKAIEAVSDELLATRGKEADVLIHSINELYHQINVEHYDEGVGLFVSDNITHFTTFPFSVKEKITIGNCFDLRDLIYKLQYFIPYYVLFFDHHEARLFSGKQKQLLELRNRAFPVQYYDDNAYELVSKPPSFSRNTISKRFKRTKAEKEQFEAFFGEVEELLSLYLEGADALILCGSTYHTAAFVNRCHYPEKIISIINRECEWFNSKDLINIVWPSVQIFTRDKMLSEIARFEDKIREGLAEEGITNVWKAVAEGRGSTLLVEKDLQIQGFVAGKSGDEFYYFRPKHYTVITSVTDAIKVLTEMALEKNIRVLFVDNGLLKKHKNIGLIADF